MMKKISSAEMHEREYKIVFLTEACDVLGFCDLQAYEQVPTTQCLKP